MKVDSRKTVAVYALLVTITLAVTFLVGMLVVQERTGMFYLSLSAILLFEIFGFLFPLLLAFKERGPNGVLRINLATTVFLSIYSVGVMILVLLAFGPVSFSTVVALQLAWLIFFMLALGANAVGFLGVLAKRRASPLAAANLKFDAFCDRLQSIQAKEATALKAEFAAIRDGMVAAEYSPDAELNSCLERLDSELSILEAAANPHNIVPASTPVPEAVETLDWELKRMKRTLARARGQGSGVRG